GTTEPAQQPSPPVAPPPPEGVAGARVLLVEDNPVNLEVAVGILESFVSRVITLFRESAPVLLTDLEEGVASGDTALLHRARHTLKSASANVGAALLSAHCKELETMA